MTIITIKSKGKRPLKFKRGALHRQLGVPEGQPIPKSKKEAALSGAKGKLARKRAVFAFKGALKQGRKTATCKQIGQ
ncbi:MAG: hypothetical protein ACTSP4_00575 [Candidatus Hodarchaeales archaeon]